MGRTKPNEDGLQPGDESSTINEEYEETKEQNTQKAGKKRKKTKRKKTKEKLLKNMKLYYTNIRGIKSKKSSLEIYLAEYQPDVIGIVETHLDEMEQIEIEGYKIWRNDEEETTKGVRLL